MTCFPNFHLHKFLYEIFHTAPFISHHIIWKRKDLRYVISPVYFLRIVDYAYAMIWIYTCRTVSLGVCDYIYLGSDSYALKSLKCRQFILYKNNLSVAILVFPNT